MNNDNKISKQEQSEYYLPRPYFETRQNDRNLERNFQLEGERYIK